uniref:BART domain-containing protein n=1 Tax=Alexandrium monilatum TaxID=311494 RepID=A0A7S4VKW9_9DINO
MAGLQGLPAAFMEFLAARPDVPQSVRDFQLAHQPLFVGHPDGQEYSLQQTESYKAFMALVDHHLSSFLAAQGASEADFTAALLELKQGQDPHWQPFDLLLRRVDFEAWAGMLIKNVCLCCGRPFQALGRPQVVDQGVPRVPVGDDPVDLQA